MYEDFFGFSRRPFSLTPDPDFLYWTDQHRRAFDLVCMSLIRHAPIALVTGEVGAGKTTLIQELLREVSDDLEVALLSNVVGDGGDLLRWILTSFGQDAEPSTRAEALREVEVFLRGVWQKGRRSVLVVDEAQNVSDAGIETLRLLTNLDLGKSAPLSLVLAGQPQLRDRLRGPRFMAFRQRLGASCHLGPMTLAETTGYVRNRLTVAGGDPGILDKGAIEAVHRRALGVPRLTNLLCDVCLVSAYGEDRLRVEAHFAEETLAESLALGGLGGLAAEAAQMSGASGQAAAAAGRAAVPLFRVAQPGAGTSTPRVGSGRPRWRSSRPPSLRVVAERFPASRGGERHEKLLQHDGACGPQPMRVVESIPTPAPDPTEPLTRTIAPKSRDWRITLGSVAAAAVAAILAGAALILPATWTGGQAVSAVATLFSEPGARRGSLSSELWFVPAVAGPSTPMFGDTSADAFSPRLAEPDPKGAELLFHQALDRATSDPAGAAIDYARAAARGHGRAAYYLAQMYETGDGVVYAPDTAWAWYAAADDVSGAEERMAELAAYPAPVLGFARPLFAAMADGVAEFAWEGRGSFLVELASVPGETADAMHPTPLTAVRLAVPPQLAWWRVRAVGGQPSEWHALGAPLARN